MSLWVAAEKHLNAWILMQLLQQESGRSSNEAC